MAFQEIVTCSPEIWRGAMVGRGAIITVNVCEAVRLGVSLSVTRTVMVLVPTLASAVAQVKRPLVELMAAPAGAPGSRLKVRTSLGLLASLALALKLTMVWAWMVRPETGASTGGETEFSSPQIPCGAPIAALTGLERLTKNTLGGGELVFKLTATVMVALVCPGLNTSVPLFGV